MVFRLVKSVSQTRGARTQAGQDGQPISALPDFGYHLDRSVIVSANPRTGAQRKKGKDGVRDPGW